VDTNIWYHVQYLTSWSLYLDLLAEIELLEKPSQRVIVRALLILIESLLDSVPTGHQ